jgi:hypothetical protein
MAIEELVPKFLFGNAIGNAIVAEALLRPEALLHRRAKAELFLQARSQIEIWERGYIVSGLFVV